jgi:bile acid:Na+ symporter, BASS family
MVMELATLISIVVRASIGLIVFGLALTASPQDALYLLRRPGQLGRSLLAMNVIMPLFAAALAAAFDLNPAVKIALITLAVSPVPPVLPKKQLKAGGRASYAVGLLVAAALLAIVFVPVAVELLGGAFGTPAQVSFAAIARLVLSTVLAPLAAGIVVRLVTPRIAERMAQPISLVATVLLVVGVLPIVFTAWPAMVSLVGNGTIVAIVAFSLAGLAAGHLLGGPDPDDRVVLALATASRHPGVALAIASANFPGQKLVPAAVLLYLIVSAIVSIPYLTWRRRQHGGIASAVET